MSNKYVCTIALLVFVAASIVTLVAKDFRQSPPSATTEDHRDRLIVYYFHGTARCPPCANIEAYTHETLTGSFAAEMKDGRVEWKAVDFEQPENEHFAQQFDLIATSVVLVQMRGGVQKNWKNLPEVWKLVDDKPAFVEFMQKEIRAFLELK
jgi:hypothetical protein